MITCDASLRRIYEIPRSGCNEGKCRGEMASQQHWPLPIDPTGLLSMFGRILSLFTFMLPKYTGVRGMLSMCQLCRAQPMLGTIQM